MPNWCNARIEFQFKTEEAAKKFNETLNSWLVDDVTDNSWNARWLGNIVEHSGIGKWDKIPCRGQVEDIDYSNDTVTIYTETAWEPMLNIWWMVKDKHCPDAEVLYYAEESGTGLYLTNDEEYEGMYFLDFWDLSYPEEDLYCIGQEKVKQVLNGWLGTNEDEFEKLVEMARDHEEIGECFILNKWELMQMEEY